MIQHFPSSDSFRGNYLKRGIICELLNSLSGGEMLRDSATLNKFTIDINILSVQYYEQQVLDPCKEVRMEVARYR